MAKRDYRELTKEQLIELLKARDRKKLGLVWERDTIEHDKALNEDFVALDRVPELDAGEGPHGNLIIEGDNFDALRALRIAYSGKVKCIYIDPPYNTGNKDFVYNDHFVDRDHAWRHSMWIEFMFQRLTLARDLLAQDGAIFVSIDDNEIFHLGMLMNEVFGEANFVANVIWRKNYSPKAAAKHFSADHEFIVCYALQGAQWIPIPMPRTDKQNNAYKNPDKDARGLWRPNNLAARNFYSKGSYAIVCPSGRVIDGPPKGSYWRYSKERFDELDADNRIWWGKDGNNVPAPKIFLSEVKQGIVPQTFWDYGDVGHTQEAKREILSIFLDSKDEIFSTPKPVRLIERILQIATNPGDLILDFFAGSGTTAHAVLKMNAANPDEAPRKFILVSSTEATTDEPEKNLCRDVCRERVANVIKGYGNVPGTGGSFAYLRTHRIPQGRILRKLDHARVWTFLQLMHFADLSTDPPHASGRLFLRDVDSSLVLYVTDLSEAVLKRLEKETSTASEATIYSWQPEALATHVSSPRITILPIPKTLLERFGSRMGLGSAAAWKDGSP